MDGCDLVNALLLAEKTPRALASAWGDVTNNWARLSPRQRTDAIRILQSKYTGLVIEKNAPYTGCCELMFAYLTFKCAQRDSDYAPLSTDDEVTKAIVIVAKGVGIRDDA